MAAPEQAITRRIKGIETEYGITCTMQDGSQRKLTPEEVARYMFRPVVEKHSSSNVFLNNASRLYLDVGAHPEVATGECDSVTQLLNHERAGDEVVDRLAREAEAALAAEGNPAQVYLFKNNVDSRGNSYGCHENYLVGRNVGLRTLGKQLLPFLITRQLIAGAGLIYRPYIGSPSEKFGLGWCISQRADHVWEGVSSATTRSRPIINTRDEPHANSEMYRRLHVIVGDSNMAEPTFALKIISAELVLEMIEAGWELPDFELENEVESIREIARDVTGTAPVRLRNGGTAHALAIQQAYCEAAHEWFKQRPEGGTPDAEIQRALDLWKRTLEAIETQDFSLVEQEIDWVIKRKLIQRYQERLGCELDHPKLAQIDLTYHDIRKGRGLYSVLESKGLIKRWTDDSSILEAVDNPPHTTRAQLRGDFLRRAEETGASVTVDWMRLKVNRPDPKMVELGDPFSAVDERIEELLAYMSGHPGTDGSAE